jgi:hypothetical protein
MAESPASLWQGRLGNCYLLAALASCADGDEDILIRDLVIEEGLDQASMLNGPDLYSRGINHSGK